MEAYPQGYWVADVQAKKAELEAKAKAAEKPQQETKEPVSNSDQSDTSEKPLKLKHYD